MDKTKENNIKTDGEEIELEVITPTDYKEGYKEFMQNIKNQAKAAGFELKFEQDVYPKRSFAMWYYGALVTLKYSDRISIVITCNNEDLEMYFKGDDSNYFSGSFEFEEAGFFTDEQVKEAASNDVINFEGSEFMIFYIEDTEKDDVTYGSDMGYDDVYTLGEAFDFNFYKDNVIPDYLKDNPAKGEDQRTDVQKTIDSLKEDKEGIKRFEDKFGKELSSRFFKIKPRLIAPENDISHWMKKDSKELTSKLDSLESTKTVKQKDEKAKEGAELLHSDENWSVYEILNVDASIKYGKDTKWCISGIDCETPIIWNKYKKTMPNFPEESSSFIFFIRKMYRDKYAVLFNKENGEYLIWNSIDNPMAFIPRAPKVKGLPDFSRVPIELKRALAKGAGIPPTRILDIAPSFEEMYTDDHLEKYTIQYRDKDDILISQGLYRSPETDEFEPLDYI